MEEENNFIEKRSTHIWGNRPGRKDGPIVKRDEVRANLIHCYGHAGSGWTLCWGTAETVTEIVSSLIGNESRSSATETTSSMPFAKL